MTIEQDAADYRMLCRINDLCTAGDAQAMDVMNRACLSLGDDSHIRNLVSTVRAMVGDRYDMPASAIGGEWVEWAGMTDLGVFPSGRVRVRLRDGSERMAASPSFSWLHWGMGSDIVAYKVIDARVNNV